MPISAGIAIVGMGMSASQSSKAGKAAEKAQQQQMDMMNQQRSEANAAIEKAEAKRKPYEQMMNDYLFSNKADVKTNNMLQRQASAQQRSIDRSMATAFSPGLAASAMRQNQFNLGNAVTSAQIQEDVNRRNIGMQMSQQVDPLLQTKLNTSNQYFSGMGQMYGQQANTMTQASAAAAQGVAQGMQSLSGLNYYGGKDSLGKPDGSFGITHVGKS
jgi:hypothetical protein